MQIDLPVFAPIAHNAQAPIIPFAWLRDVLTRIADHPQKNLAEILPQNWKPVASD